MQTFHVHCATLCKTATPTDKNCGNESKNHTTSKIFNYVLFVTKDTAAVLDDIEDKGPWRDIVVSLLYMCEA